MTALVLLLLIATILLNVKLLISFTCLFAFLIISSYHFRKQYFLACSSSLLVNYLSAYSLIFSPLHNFMKTGNSMKSISTIIPAYGKYRMFDHQSARAHLSIKKWLTRCITALCFASSSSNTLGNIPSKK